MTLGLLIVDFSRELFDSVARSPASNLRPTEAVKGDTGILSLLLFALVPAPVHTPKHCYCCIYRNTVTSRNAAAT